jgi:ankyrin repeat protein
VDGISKAHDYSTAISFKDGINCPLWLPTFHRHEKALKDNHSLGTLTPLRVAVFKGHEIIIRLLLTQSDVDLNTGNIFCTTLLLEKIIFKRHEAVIRLLLARSDVDPNIRNNLGRTPL